MKNCISIQTKKDKVVLKIEEQAEQAYAHYQLKSSIWKNAIS